MVKPIDGAVALGRLATLLREASGGEAARAQRNERKDKAKRAREDGVPTSSGIAEASSVRLEGQHPATRAFVESILVAEFGSEIVYDARFQWIVDEVHLCIEGNDGSSSDLLRLIKAQESLKR